MYYYPEITSSLHLMEDLVMDTSEAGFDVEILTATPSRNISDEELHRYKKMRNESVKENIKIHRINVVREQKNILLRIFRFLSFVFKVFGYLLTSNRDIVVVDSTPPLLLALISVWTAKIKKFKVIFRLQDIFPDTMIESGKLNNKIVVKGCNKLEKYIYCKVDKIVVISQEMRDKLLKKGIYEETILIIENWIDLSDVQEVIDDNKFIEKYSMNNDPNVFRIVFAGNLGYAQDFDIILDSARNIMSEEKVEFFIIGDGVEKKRLEDKVTQMNLTNVKFYPFQPPELVSDVYSFADVNLVTLQPGVIKTAVPSKSATIMACRRPILASIDNDSSFFEMINQNQIGIAVNARDTKAFTSAIIKLMSNKDYTSFLGDNALSYAQIYLERSNQTNKYISLLKEVGSHNVQK